MTKFLLLFSVLIFSQNTYKIQYSKKYVDKYFESYVNSYSIEEVVFNEKESKHRIILSDTAYVDINGNNFIREKFEGVVLCKNLFKNQIYSKSVPYVKGYLLIDSLNIVDWKINTNNLKVLNYNCTEASGSFRGRNYKAYFTEEIPISNGPFKFQGLPGMILKVVSEDGAVLITAKSFEKIKDVLIFDEIVEKFFKDLKPISYNDAIKKFKIMRAKLMADNTDTNGTLQISPKNIEIFLNE